MSNSVESKVVNQETASFRVSNDILYSLIYQQAGSSVKALMELVMNELDAKASEIKITISDDFKSLTVEGDGVGFTSREEIDKLFSCFGFDHDTEEEKARDRDYGRYGLGRGQIFAFASTEWHTNQFRMLVDLKNKTKKDDLPFEIFEHEESLHKGCKIFINLYEEMSIYERNTLARDLKTKLKYVKAPLLLNGERLNKEVNEESWSVKTDTLAFKAASPSISSGLDIYNKGVFVTNISHRTFGISGTVTSTSKAFDVNMARNDVQQATCPLWKELKLIVKPFVERKQKVSLTDGDCIYIMRNFISGSYDMETLTKRIITVANGSKISLKRMMSHANGIVTAPDQVPSMVGEKIHREKMATVISPRFIEDLGYDNINEFGKALIDCIGKRGEPNFNWALHYEISKMKIVSFEDIQKSINSTVSIINDADISKLMKIKLHALNKLNCYAAAISNQSVRKLKLGRSETACAWTDSVSYIALDEDLVRGAFSGGHNSLIYVLNTLIHEYCHEESSSVDHGHDDNFNLRLRRIMESKNYTPFTIITNVLEIYFRGRKKEGLEVSLSELSSADGGLTARLKKAAY